MQEWRYFVTRVDGIGAPELIIPDLPLQGVQIHDALNGPGEMSGNVPIELGWLTGDDGKPTALRPWANAIWAEASGQIRGGGIVTSCNFRGPQWALTCLGLGGYPDGMPYEDSIYFVDADPLDIVRHAWAWLQSQRGGDLGVQVDSETTTPVRIGRDVEGEEYDTPGAPSFEDGPYRLAWYETDDLGAAIDDLSATTPFDWRETRRWNADGDQVVTRIEFGYPRLGRRRKDLRFVVGENVQTIPETSIDEEAWASRLLLLGAGEGRDRVLATASRPLDGRVKRVKVVTDPNQRRRLQAGRRARRMLARIDGKPLLDSITVHEHMNAPLGSWHVGDEIRVQSDDGWAPIDDWYRITESSIAPEQAGVATLSIERTDQGVLT